MNDEDGPWWKANFGGHATITKVQILNRGDCCGGRINGAKVFIGKELCGKIENPPQGGWVDVSCKASGEFVKI
jgi:hypothetical protein